MNVTRACECAVQVVLYRTAWMRPLWKILQAKNKQKVTSKLRKCSTQNMILQNTLNSNHSQFMVVLEQ